MRKIVSFTASLLALLLLAAGAAAAPAPNASSSSERARVFVGFDRAPTAADRAAIERSGGAVRADFSELGALAVEIDAGAVGQLARLGGVSYVEPDELRYALGLATAQLAPSMSNGLYGLITTRSVNAHDRGVTGTGINACVADTGLDYNHPDIAPNYKGGIDTISNDNDPFWNNDPNETHGTHVAGTVVAAYNTVGVYGVAYSANLYYARVLGPTGGTASTVMAGVRWLVETAKCKVVNLSLGGGRKSRTEENFYKEMRNKGALVVAATGNDGSARAISYPAKYAVNIAVGAVDRNNIRASFSNGGREIDVVAPGVTVLSSVPANTGSEASVTTTSTVTAYGMEFAGQTAGTTGTLVNCGRGLAGECPAAVAGNIALIQRGDISFADKVTNAMNAGATAAVIYNNVAGDFIGTLGSATTSDGRPWIPAVTVSDTAGATLLSQVGTSATVVNEISSWDHYDGTSMATPHVTGVVALIWSVNPAMSNTTVESHLFNTCTDLGAAGFDTLYGRGIVNADAAVAAAGG
ncbi:MAG: S8 family serine peptidase [Gaiellaceae bacterium]